MSTGLTREQILGAADRTIEAVEVPEWGGVVHVRSLNGRARDKFDASRFRLKGDQVEMIHDNTRAMLLSLSLCDEAGTLIFSEADIVALGEKNAAVLDRLFDVAQRLSGLRAKDVEVKLKNSAAVQTDSSVSS